MKLFIDTNIIIDHLEEDRRNDAVHLIFQECQYRTLHGFISALTIPNVLYIERHSIRGTRREIITKSLLATFDVVNLTLNDLTYPFEREFQDYEDGLQTIAAIHADADYIITDNIKDFQNSPIPAITPRDFVEQVIVAHSPDHPHHSPRPHS